MELRPYYSKNGAELFVGDALEVLRGLPSESVNMCVTSPPYWGLRDYGVKGQLGLESTPEEYTARMVEVFREVRRVLADDGTLWLNLGDSYTSGGRDSFGTFKEDTKQATHPNIKETPRARQPQDLKPKDLVGIPWRVAFALQQPYYSGRIKDERDRIWLAAMLDAEGCMFIHKRKAGQNNGQGYQRQNDNYAPGVEIANTSLAVVERILALVGQGSVCSQGPEENERRKQIIYRWNLRTTECRDFVRELYPHLVAKQQQARILIGCPSSGERAEASHAALISLHRTGLSDVDFPEPASMFETGFYLRSDIIWKKPNPMPESVTDRPTKAHEYLFLLSKSDRYYYDANAIKEESTGCSGGAAFGKVNKEGPGSRRLSAEENARIRGYKHAQVDPQANGRRMVENTKLARQNGGEHDSPFGPTRNRRSVWTVPTQPYAGAHFATFPTKLIEPCIMAGCKQAGSVLDPFVGSGTTLQVALDCGCKAIGIELNPKYAELTRKRLEQGVLNFEPESP